jgi:putative ABC transport system permease protein
MFDHLMQDLRFALRSLRKSPVFTLVAVLTLALGIGANTAVFSVVNGVLLAPLPYEEPEQLTLIWTDFGADLPQNWLSGPEFLEMREFNSTFESIEVALPFTASFAGRGEPEEVPAGIVSGGFFDLLRVEAALGRTLQPDDDVAGIAPVVVLSDGFWRRRLGADPDVLGQELNLAGSPITVVGVLPPDFRVLHPEFTDRVDVWVPLQPVFRSSYDQMSRGAHGMRGFGRMKEGITVQQAQADLDAVAVTMGEASPDFYDFNGWGLTVLPLKADLVQDVQGALVILFGAVGFVLLIACVNVANLQLTRAAGRDREIAVRTALGAGRRRLMQQLLTESLVLGIFGAALGLVVALAMLRALVALAPEDLPRLGAVGIDATVLGFTLAAGLLTALLFGVAPWLFALRTNLVDSLKEGGRGSTAGAGARLRMGLVVAEVALAVVLLVGAGLMMRSFSRLLHTDPGYRTESVLTMQIRLPAPRYQAADMQAFWRDLIPRVERLPGVQAAGLVSELPLSGAYSSGTTLVDASEFGQRHDQIPYPFIEADRRSVTPGYFDALGMELIAGRWLTDADNQPDAEPVAVVDEEFARTFWPDGDPLEHRAAWTWNRDPETNELVANWARIVGVVRHARHYAVGENGREQLYAPVAQRVSSGMFLAVRTDVEPASLAHAIREQVWEIDPDRPVDDIATMQTRLADNVSQPRFNTVLIGSFAVVAALLAAIGLYGVIAFAVGQRTNEIGVRMALGASGGSVRGLVLRQGLTLVGVGLVVGVGASFALSRVISTLLYSVSATDPLTYAGVAALLAAVATLACLVPAARATRIDPVAALRDE